MITSQFIRYIIVGTSGTLLDLFTLILLKEVFHFPAYLAVVLNQLLVLLYTFSLQRVWTFQAGTYAHRQLIRYTVVFLFNYGVAILAMYLFNERLGINYTLVRLFNIGASVSWNYWLYRRWVYSTYSHPPSLYSLDRKEPLL